MIVWPKTRKSDLDRFRLKTSRGILLHGPPGTGKTLLARAVANEAQFNFLSVSIADLVRGDVGATEKAVTKLFATARASAPCILFFDEAQAIFASRREDDDVGTKLVSQFLSETDALTEDDGIMLLAATNLISDFEGALLRPGRFDRIVYVGALSSLDDRMRAFELCKLRHGVWAGDVNVSTWSTILGPKVTGAQIDALCRRAFLQSTFRQGTSVTKEDFNLAFEQMRGDGWS
jgi:SpoVK/Ycf46/Vps4 family AAA+-type ATPase